MILVTGATGANGSEAAKGQPEERPGIGCSASFLGSLRPGGGSECAG